MIGLSPVATVVVLLIADFAVVVGSSLRVRGNR